MEPPEKFGDPPEKPTSSSTPSPSPPGRDRRDSEEAQPAVVEVCTGIPLASTTMPVTLSHGDPYAHFSQKSNVDSSLGKGNDTADGSYGPDHRNANTNSRSSGAEGVFIREMEADDGGEASDEHLRQWTSPLCGCLNDTQSSVDNLLCCYCNLSSQANMMLHSKRGIHWPLCLGMMCVDYFFCAGVCSCLTFCTVNIVVRQSLRQRYHLPTGIGEMVKDMVAGSCCAPLALCQQHREMAARGEWPGCVLLGVDPANVVVTHVSIE